MKYGMHGCYHHAANSAKEHMANFREWDFMTSVTLPGRQLKTFVKGTKTVSIPVVKRTPI